MNIEAIEQFDTLADKYGLGAKAKLAIGGILKDSFASYTKELAAEIEELRWHKPSINETNELYKLEYKTRNATLDQVLALIK